jgi:signal transduction histidine kinase
MDYRLRRRDGEYRWVVDAGMPHVDEAGEPAGFVGTVIDIHDRILLQEEQRRLAAELAEKSRLQSEFLFTLAHELRNPLAPIRAGLEVMRTSPDVAVADNIQHVMRRQVDHMVHLVDDLLDMARLTEGKVTLRRASVPLADVVKDAIDMSTPLIEAARHQLTVRLPEEPVALHIDRHRMAQVLSNLVNNAAKYTPPGGRIESPRTTTMANWRSRSRTTASASTPRCWRRSSTCTRRLRPETAWRREDWAWDSTWCGGWCSCTTAG